MEERRCFPCDQPIIDKHPPCPLKCMQQSCTTYKDKPPVDFSKYPIVWILGGPGCGKGTQCAKITAKYGFTHFSSGDLLREQIDKNTIRAKCLKDIMGRGGLVPNKIVLDVLFDAIKLVKEPLGFLIDGYPREKSQGPAFEKTIGPASLIIYFETSDETLMNRCLLRGLETGRTDDNETAVKNRLQVFHENIASIVDLYPGIIRRINAERSVEEVFTDVKHAMDGLLAQIKQQQAAKDAAEAAAAAAIAAQAAKFKLESAKK